MKMNQQTTYFPSSHTNLSFTATPQNITPPENIYQMRLVATQDCTVKWLNAGTIRLVANIPEYFPCHPGDVLEVTRVSADGTLNAGWMTN